MARFDTRMHRPPVRIGLAQARTQQGQMLNEAERTSRGAGDFGQKELRFASVDVRLRIHKNNSGPNTAPARAAVLPMGRTRVKRGYPAVTTLPTPGGK